MHKHSEVLTWDDVDRLIDHLLPQFEGEYDAMVMITRGGIIPGGLLAEAMGITHILTAAVDFPAQIEMEKAKLMAWPHLSSFPKRTLCRDGARWWWMMCGGRGAPSPRSRIRVSSAGGFPSTCVLHFNPYRNLFGTAGPITMPPSRTHISSTLGRSIAARTGCSWINPHSRHLENLLA